jgi:hypothetical protein
VLNLCSVLLAWQNRTTAAFLKPFLHSTMKNKRKHTYRLIAWSLVLTAFFLSACEEWTLPPELVGEWKAGELFITVRTKVEKEWIFTSDTATITIKINSDHSVSGTIGTASFENGVIKKNRGNPETTGCAQVIKCGSIGKIFPDDPLSNKDVQLWLAPMEGNRIETELRYTKGMAQFPMAGMFLMKDDD